MSVVCVGADESPSIGLTCVRSAHQFSIHRENISNKHERNYLNKSKYKADN